MADIPPALCVESEDGRNMDDSGITLLSNDHREATTWGQWVSKRTSMLSVFMAIVVIAVMLASWHERAMHTGNLLDSMGLVTVGARTLQLTIISARDLPRQWWDHPDPYVVAQILGKAGTAVETEHRKDTTHADWHYLFTEKNYVPGDLIKFDLWDKDIGKDDAIASATLEPSCLSPGIQNLPLSAGGSLKVDVKCLGGESRETGMVGIAVDVQNGEKTEGKAGLWDIKYKFKGGPQQSDFFGVYTKGNECTVAFSGTNDKADAFSNVQIVTLNKCGAKIHRGFFKEMEGIMQSPDWKTKVEPFLARSCSGGVSAAGHSLGGAIASIFAACVNRKENFIQGNKFTIKELWTIGAPAASKQPLEDKTQKSGCFNGARIYNDDGREYDIVPYITNNVGFVHPHLKSVRLDKKGAVLAACTSREAEHGFEKRFRKKITSTLKNAELHDHNLYNDLVKKLYAA